MRGRQQLPAQLRRGIRPQQERMQRFRTPRYLVEGRHIAHLEGSRAQHSQDLCDSSSDTGSIISRRKSKHSRSAEGVPSFLSYYTTTSKIYKPTSTVLGQDDILILDIPMTYPSRVQKRQRICDLTQVSSN